MYSNIGYTEVRNLIEDIAGAPLGDVLRDVLLRPLGLTQARLAESTGDLAGVDMNITRYDPRWVYHGLLIGPLSEARLLLDGVIAGGLLPQCERDAMMSPFSLGDPIAGRPFKAPAYGLGLMIDNDVHGNMRYGHTGGGPGSVVAVYRTHGPGGNFTRAAFAHGEDPAPVENAAFCARARP
jgi:CubicO group peptidase (beta-lactamase class C family)